MIYTGDCLEIMPTLEAEFVQCCVTSPPYYGLRDYGCDGQIGLEATPEAYVEKLVAVFREVRRVLRDDGTVWLNLGDSYAASGKSRGNGGCGPSSAKQTTSPGSYFQSELNGKCPEGLKPKDLIGIPWRVAFALQADGWWLRQDIIWAKPNPMPESVTDRSTKAHEYIFLLTKSARYFYDTEAVKEPGSTKEGDKAGHTFGGLKRTDMMMTHSNHPGKKWEWEPTRNRRSVWTITTKPFKEAHFATFPPEIPEICIKAGTSEKGCCPECGSPWVRTTMKGEPVQQHWAPGTQDKIDKAQGKHGVSSVMNTGFTTPQITTGWQPTCGCNSPTGPHTECDDGWHNSPIPCTVLDPFSGAGTTGQVAERLGRKYIGIELNPSYAEMGENRIEAARLPLLSI